MSSRGAIHPWLIHFGCSSDATFRLVRGYQQRFLPRNTQNTRKTKSCLVDFGHYPKLEYERIVL